MKMLAAGRFKSARTKRWRSVSFARMANVGENTPDGDYDPNAKLASPPIIEAVLDIDCDMPVSLNLASLEKPARSVFQDTYPKFRAQLLQEHQFETSGDAPPTLRVKRGIQSLQLLQNDERQLVQVRAQGFSFNRLAPYSSLDDYLVEIERSWRIFLSLCAPVQIRSIRLRYINRILLPLEDGRVELGDYLALAPRLPIESEMASLGFLHQYTARELSTGNDLGLVLTSQTPENERLPIILDITVGHTGPASPEDWKWIAGQLHSLRSLKNRVFRHTLTPRCLNLFQQ